ncbi:polymeric immunoglobulin receptor isoform X40 [Carassius gibelio]|uniref:polymeric immunoglobulin receptor isoform X40 n=1 Tax=Carassius gibelio TaxID=101364 RepID=UPI0022778BB2|nr:polymeric immunoglobulin receptor isoform X40 [Carassius gibelio]
MSSCFFSIMYMMKMQGEETLQCFNRRTDSLKFIVFFLWLITGPECTTGSASRRLTVQTGGTLIIPCHYDLKYINHKKYWCFHAKSYYNYCSILAYANETKARVSVIDHPDQSFFTVTMRNLQHEDTGGYWCVVEIGGILEIDESEQLYLTVQAAPDVSVVSSSVYGHEGGDISVQCFYSSGYQNEVKQWCRYKDQSCYTVGRTNTSQSSSVQISDDGRRSFTVLMTGLRLTDSGWYYCSAGDLHVPVQLNVSESVTTEGSKRNRHYLYLELLIPAVVLLMVIVVSAVILRKKHNRNEYITEVNRVRASDTVSGNGSSSVLAENDVTYTSVIVQPKTEASSPVSVEDEVTYSSVHKWKPLNT